MGRSTGVKIVFLDVDTQLDFLYPAGALYVPGAERLIPVLARLNRYAAGQGIPLISTVDAHAEDDPEFREWPSHCVAGTIGQQKAAGTLIEERVVIPADSRDYKIAGAAQVIVEKRHVDLFAEPNLRALIEQLGAERVVVYGVVTEYCVRSAAMGLLEMGRSVDLVTDAIYALNPEDGNRAIQEFVSRAGRLVTADDVCS
jgi:nicotinamidase/pyrazinamidase